MINSVLYLSAFIAAFKGVQAGINLDSSQNVAIYWGKYAHSDSYILKIFINAHY